MGWDICKIKFDPDADAGSQMYRYHDGAVVVTKMQDLQGDDVATRTFGKIVSMGQDNWELCGVEDSLTFWFKRPAQ